LAKDTWQKILHHTLKLYIEKYGFSDVVDELTYWGAYYYDAVLAAAHALAAANNRSDGEEVLKEIHNLLPDNANTGVLELDANGDRRGA
jgi:ABC-type branched-subunit amino acid transport system substrate-binding protein